MIKIKLASKKKLKETKGTDLGEEHGLVIEETGSDISHHTLILINLNRLKETYSKIKEKFKVPPNSKLANRHISGNDLDDTEHKGSQDPVILGYIKLADYVDPDAQCFNAMSVVASAMHEKYVGKGYGKTLYRLALAFSAIKRGTPVMADRTAVSDQAAGIWNNFHSKSDDITHYFDRTGKPVNTPPGKVDKRSNNPKVMDKMDLSGRTEPTIDDCNPPMGHEDESDPVNAAYFSKAETDEFMRLTKSADGYLKDNFETPDTIRRILGDYASELFDRVYY